MFTIAKSSSRSSVGVTVESTRPLRPGGLIISLHVDDLGAWWKAETGLPLPLGLLLGMTGSPLMPGEDGRSLSMRTRGASTSLVEGRCAGHGGGAGTPWWVWS